MSATPSQGQINRSTRRTLSRFPDRARRFLAPWYRILYPMPPREVNALTPSQIAAMFGWDQEDEVRAVPYEDRPAPTPPAARAPAGSRPRRVREVRR